MPDVEALNEQQLQKNFFFRDAQERAEALAREVASLKEENENVRLLQEQGRDEETGTEMHGRPPRWKPCASLCTFFAVATNHSFHGRKRKPER